MDKYYTTFSLNIAAFLKSNGVKILKVEKENGKATFYFEKNDQVKTLVDMYLNDSTLKRFISAFRDIKDMAVNA
ncbi:hypothetical protein BC351_00220 [Paenibacillus ferrarius]|uniref:DUF5659 domain-containing protein n=1 Tax=Paenibacillus ferrarius TaxID=1469647 RepID=A0A1V4HSA2_9BACL|nr:DUF5659 domain-containing protein [Paenibacillus ferrarius]OPH61702.1 hypothetical protein BC351_00220 [Paenibacillus ferrarius]